MAASTIQHSWRRRQAITKQEKYQKDSEDAIVNLQSALRAHLARKGIATSLTKPPALTVHPDNKGRGLDMGDQDRNSSDAVELIQSAMRGYLTRQMTLQDLRQRR